MKNIILISLLILGLWGCQDDEAVFDVSMPQTNLSFRPIAGGAMMYYKLPSDAEITAIRIRYKDAFGRDILRTGSYACDSLQLVGFNEARTGIQAWVTLCNRSEVESEPLEVRFDTKDSGPVAFFSQLKVEPSWNGFQIFYNVPQKANGMAHVFYVGKNPKTQEPDTLLIKSFQIVAGTDTMVFPLKQSQPVNQVVIRTEDFRGYMVKQQVWENIEAFSTAKLEPSKFDILDPNSLAIKDEDALTGLEYLVDGDVKGEIGLDKEVYKTYVAGPECLGKTLFIVDFREPKQPSEIRLYSMLYVRNDFPEAWEDTKFGYIWDGIYYNKLPCKITVYVSNDKEDENSWKKIGSFEQDRAADMEGWWCARACGINWRYEVSSPNELDKAEPCCLSISFMASQDAFRYLRVVVDDIYEVEYAPNIDEYVTLHELEIYTKKD